MFYPRTKSLSWWLSMLLMLPGPKKLIQYGKVTGRFLEAGRRHARQKGRGHKRFLPQ